MHNDSTETGRHIADMLRQINAMINKRLRRSLRGMGLTPPQIMILTYVSKHPDCKVSDISNEFSLAASTVSSILDRLERNELIIRTRKMEDKRIVQISLSDKALQLKDSVSSTITGFMADMTNGATAEELNRITTGLELLQDVLNRNDNEKGGTTGNETDC